MNKNAKKVTALALSAAILVGAGATGVYAQKNDKEEKKESVVSPAPASAAAAAATAKDETVYVFSGADGSTQKVLVSSWLENKDKADALSDVADLQNIENVKGEESFTAGKDGKLTWNAAGEDIYYQGTSSKQVPVKMKISYTLDGKKITPEELTGKTGRVTIRFDYENTCIQKVKVNGKTEEIYVPFAMVTGTMLDTEVFRNVTVKNGKMENFGNQIAVVGIAMPGMQENLNVSKEKLEIPDFVEITADAENFSMEPTLTVATTALLNSLDTKDLNTGNLAQQAEKLTDGVTQLLDGSNQLYDGLSTLLDQSGALVNGINQLNAGAGELENGAGALGNGAAQLANGLDTLNANSATLVEGAKQVFNTLLATANTQLQQANLNIPALTIENYADVLSGAISSVGDMVYNTALEQVTAGVNAHHDEIVAGVTAAVQNAVAAQVEPQVLEGARQKAQAEIKAQETLFLTGVLSQVSQQNPAIPSGAEVYQQAVAAGKIPEEVQTQISAAVNAAMDAKLQEVMASEEIQSQVAAMTQQMIAKTMASDEIQAKIADNVEITTKQKIAETMASKEIQDKMSSAAEAAKPVIDLKTSLDSYNSFYLGLQTYTGGVATAAAGAKDLRDGAGALKDGVGTLHGGIQAMKGKTPALVEGITQLRDGSGALRDGIQKLMNEGIQKIADLAEEDLADLTDRLQATVDAAKNYHTFSGIQENTEGTVKFIYKTDSLESAK